MIKIVSTDKGTEFEVRGTQRDTFLECFSVVHAVATFMTQKFEDELKEIPGIKDFCHDTLCSIIDEVFDDKNTNNITVLKYDPEELLRQFREIQEDEENEEED